MDLWSLTVVRWVRNKYPKLRNHHTSCSIPLVDGEITDFSCFFCPITWKSNMACRKFHFYTEFFPHFPIPIGSMYAIYGNIYHQYTPFVLAYIPYCHTWILRDIEPIKSPGLLLASHSQAGTRARAARAWLWPFVMALVRYPAFLGRRWVVWSMAISGT